MIQQLVQALVRSPNEAADDVLLEAMRLGSDAEKAVALGAIMKRQTVRGLCGVIAQYDGLPESLQSQILAAIRQFHSALRECGRAEDPAVRLSAMKLIALGRQGKLTYVLSDSLHSGNEALAKGAVEALVALSRWAATSTRRLQDSDAQIDEPNPDSELSTLYRELIEQRPDIEAAVARAMDVHRGPHGADLLRAGLLLADWPGSKTLAILHTAKHGGQSPMVRRLQQAPESEQMPAFLLGASHGGLRTHFGIAFSHIADAPALDALLRRTHWLLDHQLILCMRQVTNGAWWVDSDLMHDLQRRTPADAARIGQWIAVSGVHDVVQDERLERLREHAKDDFAARMRILRVAIRRPRGASTRLLKSFLADPDERLLRMAAREFVRRRPSEYENTLLQLMTGAPESVCRVVSRSIGQVAFDQFWVRFDRMDKPTRRSAGRAMLKILPDAVDRLERRMTTAPISQQIKAIQITQELQLVDRFSKALEGLCSHANPKVRSKAIAALGQMPAVPSNLLLDRVLQDSDPRVRANAIEVLEARGDAEYLPVLAQRARAVHNRERANAIKAMHRMKVSTATAQLGTMLGDDRPEHRISALWTLKQIGWWKLLTEVGRMAKEDQNLRVRRYALGVLRDALEVLQAPRKAG